MSTCSSLANMYRGMDIIIRNCNQGNPTIIDYVNHKNPNPYDVHLFGKE